MKKVCLVGIIVSLLSLFTQAACPAPKDFYKWYYSAMAECNSKPYYQASMCRLAVLQKYNACKPD